MKIAQKETKVCASCGVEKPKTAFYSRKHSRCGVRPCCIECSKTGPGRWSKHVPPEEKVCSICKKKLPFTSFHLRKHRPGRESRCGECKNENRNRYRKPDDHLRYYAAQKVKDPEFYRRGNLRKYGITIEQFDAMLESQGGVCAVCKGPALGKGRYHVDHDHDTGKIRGLLCHKCNVALGMVQDSREHLTRLIQYLERS